MALPLIGLALVVWGVVAGCFTRSRRGIWFAGLGTMLVGLALFCLAGDNNTAFYPSSFDLHSSLAIHNASSSHYTLTAMSYVALAVPFVLVFIACFWRLMDAKPLALEQLDDETSHDLYRARSANHDHVPVAGWPSSTVPTDPPSGCCGAPGSSDTVFS